MNKLSTFRKDVIYRNHTIEIDAAKDRVTTIRLYYGEGFGRTQVSEYTQAWLGEGNALSDARSRIDLLIHSFMLLSETSLWGLLDSPITLPTHPKSCNYELWWALDVITHFHGQSRRLDVCMIRHETDRTHYLVDMSRWIVKRPNVREMPIYQKALLLIALHASRSEEYRAAKMVAVELDFENPFIRFS